MYLIGHKIYTIVATIVWVHKMIGSMEWWVVVSVILMSDDYFKTLTKGYFM